MDDKKQGPKKPTPKTENSAGFKPVDENDLRKQLIEQLDKGADEINLNKDEEEILFYLAYKAD